ncbi:PD-(D/E)XK nuclease family protein [Polyangium jinanense]|uniref:PD-(D/E)XK nuclease family protein n=1 Tax=Polyangium jinanense TaxID=2829994 RepID=UPI0023420AE0|nr:PD-(D/E)XK nuclease family protein [Polyangium jinanense]MDC3959013.1 PD-(D/E)XK nuclease family protein [Polyangium jinanense]
MRILFDPDFDHGTWPGPRGAADAIAGAAWLGPEGFLALLETHLGLATPHASLADRAAELVPRLFREDHFYGASAKTDPWATAHRLLAWRDHLWEHGWRGERLGQRRLGELAEVTLGLPPGPAERIERVSGWLEGRSVDVEEVRLLVPKATLSAAWQRVLAPLERAGVRIVSEPLSDAQAAGNLAAARGEGARITPGDPSLQLVRCHGPREGARMLAAALAADPGLGQTLFIGPDGILDEALAEFGLPTLGASSAHDAGALAALLPLTLQLAWGPVDPQLALDWLTLPDHPLDRTVAARLAATLEVWPAVGNPLWRAVSNEVPGGESFRAILDTVFVPIADRHAQIRVHDLLPRVELLERWASLHAATSPAHALVVAQAEALRGRFELAELRRLSPPRLDAVLASVVGNGAAMRRPALSGYAGVGLPGGVAGPARRIVWWNFHDAGSRRSHVSLRASERQALASIGVFLPSLGDETRAAAARARRPLHQAEETLILVAPHQDEIGEARPLHPLWDEIAGRLHDGRYRRHLHFEAPTLGKPAARTTVVVTRAERPSREHHASRPPSPRPAESPSSLQKLLGCSFCYALDYMGRIRPRTSPRLVVESRLHGLLAHEVLAAASREGVFPSESEGDARQATLAILDRLLPTHAALLLLHGHQQELLLLRDAVGGAAALLARVMHAEGLRIHTVEQEIRAELGPGVLRGTPDLVLEDPRKRLVLLDFKWSGEAYRRGELRGATSLQLAAYAMLLGRAGHEIRSLGYLILRSQRLLVRGAAIAFAEQIRPELLDETWTATEHAWARRTAELSRGEIQADGVATERHTPLREARVDRGHLLLPAPCTYCKLDLLCGRENRA